jgi:hypothetical protein
MSYPILDFQKFKLMLEGVDPNATTPTPIPFDFNFDSGQYKKESIPPQKLSNLKAQIVGQILPTLTSVKLVNQKVIITLEASTSKVGISANLARELKTQPGQAGNVALCEARMNTLKGIIIEALTETLKATPEKIGKKIEFATPVNKANQGPDKDKTGKELTQEELKNYQYIKATLTVTGEPGSVPGKITCDFKTEGRGVQGTSENNYVGFGREKNQRYVTDIPIGAKFQVTFDPLTVPDCYFVKYDDIEFLSPFIGAQSFTDGKGKTYNYVEQLTALTDLKDKINAELAAAGATGTVDTLRPDFFTADGKVSIQPGPRQNPKVGVTTFEATRDALESDITIRVFSPLQTTLFSIRSGCTNPKTQP